MEQLIAPGPSGPADLKIWQLPILEVRPYKTCFIKVNVSCFAPLAAVTVQIPFEMANLFDVCSDCPYAEPVLQVSTNGQGTYPTAVIALPDKIHILKVFDSVMPILPSTNAPAVFGPCETLTVNDNSAPDDVTGLPCPPIVKHHDGALVSTTYPAEPGITWILE